jgi:amidase
MRGGINRRNFLRTGLGGSALIGILPSLNAAESSGRDSSTTGGQPFEFDEVTGSSLQESMGKGRATSRSITEKYITRIKAIDQNGPQLNSVIELNPDAMQIAAALDKEREEKGPRGPLHGIPVLIKDNIDTADAMATTAGSLALIGAKPPSDSFMVQKLRKAGAVLLGKTNLSEWANIRSTRSSSGWSGRGGLSKNPYALDRNCSGSSSGSGAAAAANLCVMAVGTETDGSIISPSSTQCLVGIKPTVGLISRTGIIPISQTQDTAGPMARTVQDAALLLGAMTGVDPEDSATLDSKGNFQSDYTRFLDPNGLRGARIGVVRRYFGFHEGVDELMAAALEAMRKTGAAVVDPVAADALGQLEKNENLVLRYELKAGLNNYLARLGPAAPVHTLKEVIEFNEKNKDREMPYFQQEVFLQAEEKGPLTEKEYQDARANNLRLARDEGIDAMMNKHQLDALVAPSEGPAWLTDLIDGDRSLGSSTPAAAVAGYPSITVPAGFVYGLPVGISFFGRAWSEPVLIKLAFAFEQATKHRRSPKFLPTADLRAS